MNAIALNDAISHKSKRSKAVSNKKDNRSVKKKKEKKEKKEEEADLFDMMGTTKYHNKRHFDYEDVMGEFDEVSRSFIDKTAEDRILYDPEITCKPIKVEELHSNNIDWRVGTFFSNRYQYGCFALFLTSLLNFASAILYYEYDYLLLYYTNVAEVTSSSAGNDEVYSAIVNQRQVIDDMRDIYYNGSQTALLSVLLCSLLTEITLAMMHSEYLDWKKSIRLLSPDETFVQSKEFKSYLIQSLITFIQPFYFLNDVTFTMYVNDTSSTQVKLNYVFLTIYLPTRYWNMIKYLIVSSYFYSPRAQRFASMYQTEVSVSFALKCVLKSAPLTCISLLLFSNMFLGGYLIRIWERFSVVRPYEDFDSFQNCIWYAFITMSTVGFGDMFAKSIFGRIVAVLVAILGVFINATMTVIMADSFNFKGGELKAYNMLNQIEMNENLDLITKRLFTKCFKIYTVRKQKEKFANNPGLYNRLTNLDHNLIRERDNLMKHLKEIKEHIRTRFKSEPIDLVIDKLVDVRKSVKRIKQSIDSFEEVIEYNKENYRHLESLKNTVLAQEE